MNEDSKSERTAEDIDLADKSLQVIGSRLKRCYETRDDDATIFDIPDCLRRLDLAEHSAKA